MIAVLKNIKVYLHSVETISVCAGMSKIGREPLLSMDVIC
jgi:hypothetical protein